MSRQNVASAGTGAGVWKIRLGWISGAVCILVVCGLVRQNWGPSDANAQPPTAQRRTAGGSPSTPAGANSPSGEAPQPAQQQIMAVVNGREVRRNTLAMTCAERYGSEVLEMLVNKKLISIHCQQQNIVVTQNDVDEEIERLATGFKLPKDQYLKMLDKERGIKPEQYANDVIWPMVALRRLASGKLQVTERELHEAYESHFGPAVQTRLIATPDLNEARRIHTRLQAQPDDFPKLARQFSQDANSASSGGLLPPIFKHVGDQRIEQAIFQLEEGQISSILRIGEQYAIFRCEKHIEAQNVPLEAVQANLVERIRDKKLHDAADVLLKQFQAEAVVENIYNDPVKGRQMPGVAATINGHRILISELAEECLTRYGDVILEGEINRILLEQELKKRNIQVTEADLEQEVAHAAELSGVVTPDGKPDLAKWRQEVVKYEKVPYRLYLRDAVWPSTALKRLVEQEIVITHEDIQKGYEANYGPKVRCRAIMMANQRKAVEVWDKARQKPTIENFGLLAEQYSVEASSRSLKGEVPPIGRHGGHPILEKAAFSLQPGEISEIVQVSDMFVILYCEGYTKPNNIKMEEVRDLIHRDILEKKLRLAMGERFERIRAAARIDNFLAGTSQSPQRSKNQARSGIQQTSGVSRTR